MNMKRLTDAAISLDVNLEWSWAEFFLKFRLKHTILCGTIESPEGLNHGSLELVLK